MSENKDQLMLEKTQAESEYWFREFKRIQAAHKDLQARHNSALATLDREQRLNKDIDQRLELIHETEQFMRKGYYPHFYLARVTVEGLQEELARARQWKPVAIKRGLQTEFRRPKPGRKLSEWQEYADQLEQQIIHLHGVTAK